MIIDNRILPWRIAVVIGLCLAISGLALVDALAIYPGLVLCPDRPGAYCIFDLYTKVFSHIQRQPLAVRPLLDCSALRQRKLSRILV